MAIFQDKNMHYLNFLPPPKDQIRVKREKLTINSVLFMDMFKELIQNIIHEIRTIFQHERCSDVSAIMMVGGFSEVDVIQNALKKKHFLTLKCSFQ